MMQQQVSIHYIIKLMRKVNFLLIWTLSHVKILHVTINFWCDVLHAVGVIEPVHFCLFIQLKIVNVLSEMSHVSFLSKSHKIRREMIRLIRFDSFQNFRGSFFFAKLISDRNKPVHEPKWVVSVHFIEKWAVLPKMSRRISYASPVVLSPPILSPFDTSLP